MDLFKLLGIFLIIIVVLRFKQPLYVAIIAGIIVTVPLYGIPLGEALGITWKSVTSFSTISVILSFYTITFLQRMLEKREAIMKARVALNGISSNRRINTMFAPAFIGLLPSAGAVYICGDMVDALVGDHLSKEDKTIVTSFYRHIPEAFLPTYASILIALQISKISASAFVIGMLPMVAALFFVGYIFYIRKIPKDTGIAKSEDKMGEIKTIITNIWPIALTIVIVVALNQPVYIVTPIVALLYVFVGKFKIKELGPMVISAFESKIIVNTFLIMIFKDLITYTGVINQLPEVFSHLPIPTFLAFAVIFFLGAVVSGSTAIIVLGMPLAYAAIPNGGLPLLILLMSFSYAAMQISPTHICLFMVAEFFHTTFGGLVKKTMPVILTFCAIVCVYYVILALIMGIPIV